MNTTTAQNELIEALDYVIDKFNIKLDLSAQQTMDFIKQFTNKIIVWEVSNKILAIVISIAFIVVFIKLTKNKARLFNKKVFTNFEVLLTSSDEQICRGDFPKDSWGEVSENYENTEKEKVDDNEKIKEQKERERNTREFNATVYRAIACTLYTCVAYIILVGCTIHIIINLIDLLLCAIFPEKIVLEFIGQYIR